ncbi:hypothetical protein BD410DRAFT_41369 [Rickenella mellea]|uniref:Uncharacterized protein n=1 Tax=Rickenella mellea TaxID=50990 RepID=A0A4R5XF97_9AGAM|nr:hypothetical protein BD410DRAFT_41369 [Rickenella mellea]
MDHVQLNDEKTREQAILAAKKRLESFQFRRANNKAPSPQTWSPKSHSRSHSRNSSISSLSISTSTSSTLSSASDLSSSSSSNEPRPSSLNGGRQRPTSHHRRRSSVSTRVESAELMGVTLPELPASSSEENGIFGDKDSLRRRALLALEGKSDLDSPTSTVEIPVLESPSVESKPFEFPGKPSSTTSPPFAPNNPFASKRDSFGKHFSLSVSLKDQLHTLMEEEEEEEEQLLPTSRSAEPLSSTKSAFQDTSDELESSDIAADTTMTMDTPEVSVTTPSPAPNRHRPTNLVLRPLSLTPSPPVYCLPSPAPTPSPRTNGLRSLTLSPDPDNSTPIRSGEGRRQRSLVLTPSPSPASVMSLRRQSMFSPASPLADGSQAASKRSSISYIRSGPSPTPSTKAAASLPTPGATPTTEKRLSISSTTSDTESLAGSERSVGANDPAFLYHSHATLLARITDLERALHARPRSRASSIHSDFSASPSEPSDEMLQLVTDLKSERDELTRDIEGWRQRVADMQRVQGVLERRVESERRESWLKGERMGVLEVEKESLARQLKEKQEALESLQLKLSSVTTQLDKISAAHVAKLQELEDVSEQLEGSKAEAGKARDMEQELAFLRNALFEERKVREGLEGQLEMAGLLDTPTPNSGDHHVFSRMPNRVMAKVASRSSGLGFTSIDSEGSYTDVESVDDHRSKGPFTLKSVEEEPEDMEGCMSDEEDGLAGYEDERDSDISFQSPGSASSSFDGDLPRTTSHLRLLARSPSYEVPHSACASPSPSPTPSPTPCATPVPNKDAFSKLWTFPRGVQSQSSPQREPEKVDHFFGCLEDVDDSPPLPTVKKLGDKSVFSQSLRMLDDYDDDDSLPPFVIPAQVGDSKMLLDVVMEEDEEEDEIQGEEYEGGVKFTFSAPQLQPQVTQSQTPSPPLSSRPKTPVSRIPTPRKSITNNSSFDKDLSPPSPVTPMRSAFSFPAGPEAFITPPNPRLAPTSRIPAPSRIPPPTPPRFSATSKQRTTTFIPAPHRKPVPAYNSAVKPANTKRGSTAEVAVNLSPKSSRNMNAADVNVNDCPFPSLASAPHVSHRFPVNTNISEHAINTDVVQPPSLSARFSFQKLTNLIPMPSLWSPRRRQAVIEDEIETLNADTEKRQRGYVSKEQQLAKLRARMASEYHPVSGWQSQLEGASEQCSRCDGGLISL